MSTMFTVRRSLAALLLATPALTSAALALPPVPPTPPAVVAPRAAVDPTGVFEWSIEAQGQAFSGLLTITKVNDTTYAATVGHATLGESAKATSVKLEGDVLTVVSPTQYGELTQQIKFTDPLQGQWWVGDGQMGGGMKVARQPKKP